MLNNSKYPCYPRQEIGSKGDLACNLLNTCAFTGAARREVLELRAYKENADAALALAEKRIQELTQDLNAVAAKMEIAAGKVT